MEKKTLRSLFLENTTPSGSQAEAVTHPHQDLPSFSQSDTSPVAITGHDEVSEAGEPSSSYAADGQLLSSSSVSKVSDLTNNILTAANAVDAEDVDADVDRLIDYIIDLLEHIKDKKKVKEPSMKEGAKPSWKISSESLKTFREVLSEAINVFKDVIPGEAKTVIKGLSNAMGAAHLTTTGFLIVAHVLERIETVSTNRDNCLCVLDEICNVAQHVKKLRRRDGLKDGMEHSIKEAMGLIVEASIMCSNQIGSSKGWKFLTASGNKEKLEHFEQSLQRMYRHMDTEVTICLYDAIDSRQVRPQKPRERPYPGYAVGIQKPLEEVLELLEWESKENAVAVIVHGFGGMGKTTLADALFALHNREGCKYSTVRLFDDVTSTPNIIMLQKYIIEDLKMGMEMPDIRTFEDGQREIERILQKEETFIYIDNVLNRDRLEQLLPRYMDKAKKLRLLITTRDSDVCIGFKKLKRNNYPMKGLPHIEAKNLLEKEMDSDTDNKENQLSSGQLDEIVEMCGYIPKLLTVIAGFINCADDQQIAYRRLKEEKEKNWKGEIGDDIEKYVFAYQTLEERLKDPFLDICSFFNGWDWSKVEHIVGDRELNSLEKRTLVTKTTYSDITTVWVHDVILEMGLRQADGTRFTRANKLQEFLNGKEDEDIRKIKGIMLWQNAGYSDHLSISPSTLDLMSNSLRVLELGDSAKVEGKCKKIFEKLVYCVAEISDFPFDVSMSKEMKYLDLTQEDEDLNQELTLSKFQYLRVLKLSKFKNLRRLPDNFGSLNYLQELDLYMCTGLEALPSSLGKLSSLQALSVRECSRLNALPSSLGELSSLQALSVSRCNRLNALPSSLGELSSLQALSVIRCNRLNALPSSLGKLLSLRELDLWGCESLKYLPDELGKLSSLNELNLQWCEELSSIPESVGQLLSLRKLDLCGCHSLKYLPHELGKLSSLNELNLEGCKELSSIPESVGQLKSLKSSMNLSATGLKELPDGFCNLSSITQLEMSSCDCLKKLPESFGRLICLEHLDLSECTILEELCTVGFNGLSSLRVLLLDYCKMLKKLPEDFHCLTSLEVLGLRDCPMLEGKWMESMLKMKTVQIVDIRGSPMLEGRWEEIEKHGDHSWSFAVYTGQVSSNEVSKVHILKQLHSKIDSILTKGRLSDLPLNTLLLVVFDGGEKFYDDFPWSLIEENIDDFQTNFEMIYFGDHFNKFPKKTAERILGHAPANSNAQTLFRKVLVAFCAEEDWRYGMSLINDECPCKMSAKIVNDEKGDKYLSSCELLSVKSVEEFVIKKCGRYLKLKQLVEKPGESNIELLRELFASEEEESTLCFLKNDASEVRVEELERKTILLDISSAGKYSDIPLQSLMEMYVAERERLDFEIITIPITEDINYVFDEFSRQVPWLIVQNPWQQLKSVIKFFLVEACAAWIEESRWGIEWDSWYSGIMRVIESNGTIAAHNPALLRMVNTWEAKAYPFTEEKRKELEKEERNQMKAMSNLEEEERNQMKAMSNLEFLFKHLESLRDQVKQVMFKEKIVCLYTSEKAEVARSVKDMLIELRDDIHMIYIPLFKSQMGQPLSFTESISGYELVPRGPKMAQIEGMSILNLSNHDAIRFWARIFSLKECIDGMKDNDKHLVEVKNLLYFIDEGLSWMTGMQQKGWMSIIDEDGKLVITTEEEILENPKDKTKELILEFIKGPKEHRKEILIQLEQLKV